MPISDQVADLAAKAAVTTPDDRNAVQSSALIQSIKEALDLEAKMKDLNLGDIQLTFNLGGAQNPEYAIPTFQQSGCTVELSGITQVRINICSQLADSNDTHTELFTNFYKDMPVANLTRYDLLCVELQKAGGGAFGTDNVLVRVAENINTGDPTTDAGNLVQVDMSKVLIGVRPSFVISGPIWSRPGHTLRVTVDNVRDSASAGTTVFVYSWAVTGPANTFFSGPTGGGQATVWTA